MLYFVAVMPHPPIVIREVGKDETEKVSKTAHSMEKLAVQINAAGPELIVAITPHGPVFSNVITVNALETLEGDLAQFGAGGVSVRYELDKEAVTKIIEGCSQHSLPCAALDRSLLRRHGCSDRLDHGLVVPLSFIQGAGWQGKLVPINIGLLPYEELYHFGIVLRDVLNALERNWVVLVSADMSHRLIPGAPAGYSPQGAVFDEIIRQSLQEGDVTRIIQLDRKLIEDAGECGFRPLVMGLGTLDGYQIAAEEFSYEGPFGVGYYVGKLTPGKEASTRKLCRSFYERRQERVRAKQKQESTEVQLARESIEYYLSSGKYLPTPPKAEKLEHIKASCFVSIKKHGMLRGCIGTIEPARENLAKEIIYNAVSAACQDPRFPTIEKEELPDLEISVDVLEKPEPVKDISQLDPEVYGVIVSKGRRKGLLLPQLEGVNTVREQLNIAKQKAGIGADEQVEIERFKVTRYT